MSKPQEHNKFFIAVTGAQGVGKSTFCEILRNEIGNIWGSENVRLLEGLGKRIFEQGISYGSQATAESIAAIYAAHIERETQCSGEMIILDRCCIDALAYVRCLGITDQHSSRLYEQVSRLMSSRINVVIHLEMTGIFLEKKALHESESLRNCVAASIPVILGELDADHITINAGELSAINKVMSKITGLCNR